ncbi:MAG TPA: hypothetical protein VGL13_14835 [Polyangiaceae bacterium]
MSPSRKESDRRSPASNAPSLHRSFVRRIDAHFARAISPSEEKTMRGHLPACEPCRQYYQRHLLLEELEPDGGDAQSRIAAGLGLPTSRASSPFAYAFAAVAALALIALVPLLGWLFSGKGASHDADPAVFAARGAPSTAAAPHLLVYRMTRNRPAELVDSTVAASDELAFAYTNAESFERLLVFGVDEHQHVYWYYPAWSSEGENPVAVPILPGPEVHELGEAVSQHLDGHRLRITAVFTHDTVSVKEVEAKLHTGAAELNLGGALQVSKTLEIER